MKIRAILIAGFMLILFSASFGEKALIYKDVSIIQTDFTKTSRITVPAYAYDLEFQPSSIKVFNTAATNYYPVEVKDKLKTLENLTGIYSNLIKERVKMEEEIKRMTSKNTMYEKLTVTLAQNNSIKFSETLNKYFDAYKDNLTKMDDMKRKLNQQNEEIKDLYNKINELDNQLRPYAVPMKTLTFSSNVSGELAYKIGSSWSPKYSINLDKKNISMDIEINPLQAASIPIEECLIFSFFWKPSIQSMELKKLMLYLTEKYAYQLNMPASKKMYENAPAPEMDRKVKSEALINTGEEKNQPEMTEESADTGTAWNIEKPFILERLARIPVLKMNPIEIKQSYFVIPSKSVWGFSVIEISNVSDFTILPGEASLLSGKLEVPGMPITLPLPPGAAFQFPGIETKSIQTERKLTLNFRENPTLFRNTILLSKEFQIKTKNTGGRDAEITVLDRLPIPADNRIILKNISVSEKSADDIQYCLTNKSGILEWKVKLKPNENKVLKIGYSIEYPDKFILADREE